MRNSNGKTDKYLNVGCGERFHPAWINVDFDGTDEQVIRVDLRQGIPFPSTSFDVVYHSHLLEHFAKFAAKKFLKECYRVLVGGGIIRVVVPDLEQIVRTYLALIDAPNRDSPEWRASHEWMIMEMYDQTVRTQSGGGFGSFVLEESHLNREFVLQRWGGEARKMFRELGSRALAHRDHESLERSYRLTLMRLSKYAYRGFRPLFHPREALLRVLLGQEYSALQVARFRDSGEIHQWMYDRYSLGRLLGEVGFVEIVPQSPSTSRVSNWTVFNLDTEPDGSPYKPDSLYIEARKPIVAAVR